MNNDIKSGVGYIIPLGAIIGFFTALFLGENLFSIYIAIAGILVWFLYMVIMESSPPSNLGNLIIFFGVLLSIGVFMGFGVTQNMWGGVEFVSEGFLFALVILFFSILTGMLMRGVYGESGGVNPRRRAKRRVGKCVPPGQQPSPQASPSAPWWAAACPSAGSRGHS